VQSTASLDACLVSYSISVPTLSAHCRVHSSAAAAAATAAAAAANVRYRCGNVCAASQFCKKSQCVCISYGYKSCSYSSPTAAPAPSATTSTRARLPAVSVITAAQPPQSVCRVAAPAQQASRHARTQPAAQPRTASTQHQTPATAAGATTGASVTRCASMGVARVPTQCVSGGRNSTWCGYQQR
jgi:hypothetical protein